MAEFEVPKPEELEDLGAKTFTKRVALITTIFAVLLVLSFLGSNSAGREALLAQQRLSDQLAATQLTSVQEQLSTMNGRRMEADLLDRGPSMQPNVRKLYQFMLKDMKADETRYREEKKKSEEETRRLEVTRNKSLAKDRSFNTAGVCLMLSLIMTSISILTVSRRIFHFAIGVASIGTLVMLYGFSLIFR